MTGTLNESDAAAVIAAIESGTPIEHHYAHVALTTNDDDKIDIPIRRVTDGEGGSKLEVFSDALDALEKRQPAPARRTTSHTLHELDSLIAHVNRYKSADAIAWADVAAARIVVVFNDHPQGHIGAAWRDHRATYTCPKSPEWLAWCALDGQSMTQARFADFVESRLEDLKQHNETMSKPLDVLQMARNLVIRSKGTFERQLNPTTGENLLVNKNEHESTSTPIPRAFGLAISVFEGGTKYAVEARVRLQMVEGVPMFGYVLHRRKEIERDAFNDVRKAVNDQCSILILAGTP
jgi:uncharacterized protein YfdQ (DUF2303 family)